MNTQVRQALDSLQNRVRRCDRVQGALRELLALIEESAVYDPIKDTIAIRLPGEFVRRLRALTDTP